MEETYDFYEKARLSFAPTFENKLSSTSFQNMITGGKHLELAAVESIAWLRRYLESAQ